MSSKDLAGAGLAATQTGDTTKPAMLEATETKGKKKFGKNLNKITAPPAPATAQAKSNVSSDKNGLLLLSTKQNAGGGGILSAKGSAGHHQKPLPMLGLHTESKPSTHDALMGVVVGASRKESQQQPDAWRVADNKQPVEKVDWNAAEQQDLWPIEAQTDQQKVDAGDNGKDPNLKWDEYGGRHEEQMKDPSQRATALEQIPPIYEAPSSREWSKPRKLFDPNSAQPESSQPAAAYNNRKTSNGPSSPPANNYATDYGSYERQQPSSSIKATNTFDDQGRGGNRGAGAAPRMLFDPKSGSMVEVSSNRAEGGRGSRSSRKVQNSRKGKQRQHDVAAKPMAKAMGKGGPTDEPRGRAGDDATSSNKKEKTRISATRELPRTCGVLFHRDEKGGFVCTDQCDGDLGYGVHSVPGGRVNNPIAYSVYTRNISPKTKSRGTNGQEQSKQDVPTSSEENRAQMDWIKPNEKIELITGVDESPTLKANASEWVPSNMAYSTTPKDDTVQVSSGQSTDGNDDEDQDDVDDQFGLGFDPALNMDSMMQSPSMEPSAGLDLTTLSLEPAFQGPGSGKSSHNIFAFESGSTWGNSNAAAVNNDWAMPSKATFGSSSENNGSNALPASFLSMPPGNAWGGLNPSADTNNSQAPKD